MNEHHPIDGPGRGGNRGWLDLYLPDQQVVAMPPRQKLIDIPAIRGLIYRQRWLVAGVIVAAALMGLIVTLLSTPMYEAKSSVRIEPYGSFIVEGQDVDQGIAPSQVFELMSTQIAVITSRKLANQVAENLKLGQRADFLGKDIDEQRPPNVSDAQWSKTKQDLAAAKLQAGVSAELPQNNWIIEIAFRSDDPVIAAEIANAYSAAFVASDAETNIAANEYAKTYLLEQIELTRQRLGEAEQAANAYARRSAIFVQPGQTEDDQTAPTLTTSSLASINQRAATATAERIAAEQRWRSIQNLPASQLPEAQSSPVLQGLVTDRTLKAAQLADLRQRYDDRFPQIANLRAQIEALDQQIGRTSADIKAAVRNQYVVALNQEQALKREVGAVTGDAMAEQDAQVEYSVLEREAQAQRDQLQALLNRYNQVATAANVQTGTINPLDSALVPGSPYAPSLFRNMAMAIVFGIALAGGLAVLREVIDDRIRSLDDIEERLGIPLIGHTPFVEKRDIEFDSGNRFGDLMEAYASIRSTIDFSLPRGSNVIQLTSSQASEGKSTSAVILAELFAGLGRKTLLIDSDLRRPSIVSLLDLEQPKHGLVEVLLGEADLNSVTIKGVHDNLEILPIGQLPSNPTELLASTQMQDFIDRCRDEYALVIFDSCPVLGLADAPMLARLVDGTIFVLEANKVHFGQAKAAIRRVRQSGGNVFGAILTKYRPMEAGQDYSYQYHYYRYGSEK